MHTANRAAPQRQWHLLALVIVLLGLCTSTAAAASDLAAAALPPVGNAAKGTATDTADSAPPLASPAPPPAALPVRITVGRALDLEGTPVVLRAAPSAAKSLRNLALSGPLSAPKGSPLALGYLTSRFGLRSDPILGGARLHAGVDLAAPAGTPIYATMDGMVGRAGWAGGYGLSVSLLGPGGIETRYGHMSRVAVAPGQFVRRGEIIGYVGSTGRSTGPHVHYEVRINGRAVNPGGY